MFHSVPGGRVPPRCCFRSPSRSPPAAAAPPPTASDAGTSSAAAEEQAFPVTVTGDDGDLTLDAQPESIVSMSATATEMLFAIGAGPQVEAVDSTSNYPEDAPITDLSAFTPTPRRSPPTSRTWSCSATT